MEGMRETVDTPAALIPRENADLVHSAERAGLEMAECERNLYPGRKLNCSCLRRKEEKT
jgi:hypothetical protein